LFSVVAFKILTFHKVV